MFGLVIDLASALDSHGKSMKFLAGLFLFLCGAGILGWIGYNLFVEMQPEAEGRRIVSPLLFSTTLVIVGGSLMAQGFSLRGFAILGGVGCDRDWSGDYRSDRQL